MKYILIVMSLSVLIPIYEAWQDDDIWQKMLAFSSIATKTSIMILVVSVLRNDWSIGVVAVIILAVGNAALMLLAHLIKSLNKKVGIFIEVDEQIDEDLLTKIIQYKINWIVLMGVPVGFGGQFFNEQVLFKAKTLRQFSVKNKLDLKIEVDGGLNRDNILLCQKFGVDYLAGWSLVKSDNLNKIQKNISVINKKLKNDL